MSSSYLRSVLTAGLLAAAVTSSAAQSVAQDSAALATYRNERHGFSFSYPAAQFIALPSPTEDGRQFVSKDGTARLLVGTLPNFDNKNLRDYRTFVLNESYPGAKVDYAPLRGTWFVVSGIHNGMAFYQRVNFACGSRNINSWAAVFPEGQKAVYEPIIEQVHRDNRLGTGNCNQRLTNADRRTP
ncbi:MAG TPA: hypothetical protein VFI87_16920 [Hyphomicrobiaceae bacterium]|nr:hypothetical protein [Hyphomicrobiaceae bacterium]